MSAPAIFRAVWLAGGLALLLGLAREPFFNLLPPPRELPRLDGATGRPWVTGDFVPVRGLQQIAAGPLRGNLQQATSWVQGDAAQGRAETAWFRASRSVVHVGVAGYPQLPGIRLWAEFRRPDNTIVRVDCPLPNPTEQWEIWSFPRPPDATAVRLIAEDRSSAMFGWVAFTHPSRAWPGWVTAAYLHLQVYTTVALALTLLWGPGLLLLHRATSSVARGLVLLAAGPLALAAMGVLLWCASGWLSPQLLGFAGVTVCWLAIDAAGWRRCSQISTSSGQTAAATAIPLSPTAQRALAVTALVVVAVTAKSTYSVGPEGETFRGAISRNLAAGDRLDSRFPFYVVQAAVHHLGPAAPATERFFRPWTFFSRGPLAGLTAIPVVLATGGHPPADFPEQRWSPFDREGFAAYRITLIVLAGGVILACFFVLAALLGEAWALVAGGLVALSPFGVHEVMFTWPKWIATAWLVLSFGLVHGRRPLSAGLALGLGFLYHPLVLLWTPWLALWVVGREWRGRGAATESNPTPARASWPQATRSIAWFAGGAGLLVVPWMVLGKVMPHLPDTPFAGQGGFFTYWRLADSHLGNWEQWWHARWMNFANTFLPLHLYFSNFSFHHFRLNSTYETSGRLVKFAFVWWNTLPFALGLGLWSLSLAAAGHAWRIARSATLLFVAGPALLAVLYWGMDPLGLMRECGHPLFIAIIALLCFVGARRGRWLGRVLAHRALPWLQLPETLLMLWLTTLLNPRPWAASHPDLDALALALNVFALGGAAWVLSRHRPAVPAVPTSEVASAQRPRSIRLWLLAVAAGLVCYGATFPGRALHPAIAELAVRSEGSFQRDGQFAGEPLAHGRGVRLWGSWSGADTNTGSLRFGPFVAGETIRFALGGYPTRAGNQIFAERPDTGARLPYQALSDIGERWRIAELTLPPDWRGQPVTLVARDDARDLGGWIGISEPIRGGHGEGNAFLPASLSAWLLNGTLLGVLWYAALRWLRTRAWVAPHWLPLLASGVVATAGYAVFWAYFAHPLLGQLAWGALFLGGCWGAFRPKASPASHHADELAAPKLLLAIGLFYLAWLHLFPAALDYHSLAAQRFRALPGDNTLPHNVAHALLRGLPLKSADADWLSSDRPPLQSGWLLLARPATALLDLDERTAHGTAALWFESLWVFGVFGLFRTLDLPRSRALAWSALLAFTGFFTLNTLFTWPKLSAAAFAVGAFALWFRPGTSPAGRREILLGAGLAGLAWLAHGGVAFSFLALTPAIAIAAGRGNWRPWLLAAAIFAAFALPWFAYQRFYDPPGNRLLKWHLAGVTAKDSRGTWETLRASYGALSRGEFARHKLGNLSFQFEGDWRWWRDFSPAVIKLHRDDEFFHTARALTWWLLGFAALPIALARQRNRESWPFDRALAAWTLVTIAVWCLLMFGGRTAMVHQGSYATMLALFVLLSVWCERASPWSFIVIAGLQAATFLATWTTPTIPTGRSPDLAAVIVAAAAVIAILAHVLRAHWAERTKAGLSPSDSQRGSIAHPS